VKRIVMVTTELEVVAGSAVHARVLKDGCEMWGTAVGGGQPWTGVGVAPGPARQRARAWRDAVGEVVDEMKRMRETESV
jgi:hypothetical protein